MSLAVKGSQVGESVFIHKNNILPSHLVVLPFPHSQCGLNSKELQAKTILFCAKTVPRVTLIKVIFSMAPQ